MHGRTKSEQDDASHPDPLQDLLHLLVLAGSCDLIGVKADGVHLGHLCATSQMIATTKTTDRNMSIIFWRNRSTACLSCMLRRTLMGGEWSGQCTGTLLPPPDRGRRSRTAAGLL